MRFAVCEYKKTGRSPRRIGIAVGCGEGYNDTAFIIDAETMTPVSHYWNSVISPEKGCAELQIQREDGTTIDPYKSYLVFFKNWKAENRAIAKERKDGTRAKGTKKRAKR